MAKRIFLVIICALILVIPAYSYAGDSGGKEKSKDTSVSCQGKSCDQAACCENCKCDCCKNGKCTCDGKCDCQCCKDGKCCCEGKGAGKSACKDCKGECGKDCKCACHKQKKCDGKCEGRDCSRENCVKAGKKECPMGKAGKDMPCMMKSGKTMKGDMKSEKKVKVMIMKKDGMHYPSPAMHHPMMIAPKSPLDRAAQQFIEQNVKKIAIMPFSDYSITSGYETASFETWAARRIYDLLSAEFVKTGKLVVPYDVMANSLAEVKKIKAQEASGAQYLQQQLSGMDVSSQYAMDIVQNVYGMGAAGMGPGKQMAALSLTRDEVKAIGKNLGVEALFMGSISDYGTMRHIKADARTFIPPFLGIINPSKKSTIRMMVYLYNAKTGELIWESMEEISREPNFPLFSSTQANYDYLNKKVAERIANHFRNVFIPVKGLEQKPSPTGGPGMTRREKNIHEIVKQ